MTDERKTNNGRRGTTRDRSVAPVFVVAPARSYSSVTVAMLGRHPDLYAFPELVLFREDHVGGLLSGPVERRGPPLSAKLAGLLRAIAEIHEGEQTAASVQRARVWLQARASWQTYDVFDHLLDAVSPRIGVEKSPENSGQIEFLQRMTSAYPAARYLHLVRHPVATAASMVRVWQPLNYWDVAPNLFGQFCLAVWYFHHERLTRFGNGLPPERFLRVHGEHVINEPHRTLPVICRWLGISDDSSYVEQMCHPDRSPYATLGPEGATGGYDPQFLRGPQLRHSPVPAGFDIPQDWVVDPWFHLAVTRLAEDLGYSGAGADPGRRTDHDQPLDCLSDQSSKPTMSVGKPRSEEIPASRASGRKKNGTRVGERSRPERTDWVESKGSHGADAMGSVYPASTRPARVHQRGGPAVVSVEPRPGWHRFRGEWPPHLTGHALVVPADAGGLAARERELVTAMAATKEMAPATVGPTAGVNPMLRRARVTWLGINANTAWIFARAASLALFANREAGWELDLRGPAPAIQVSRYDSADKGTFDWHIDIGAGSTRFRKLTVVIELEAAEAGGNLECRTGAVARHIPLRPGAAVVFPTYLQHRVTPVERGHRLSLVSWICGEPFR